MVLPEASEQQAMVRRQSPDGEEDVLVQVENWAVGNEKWGIGLPARAPGGEAWGDGGLHALNSIWEAGQTECRMDRGRVMLELRLPCPCCLVTDSVAEESSTKWANDAASAVRSLVRSAEVGGDTAAACGSAQVLSALVVN